MATGRKKVPTGSGKRKHRSNRTTHATSRRPLNGQHTNTGSTASVANQEPAPIYSTATFQVADDHGGTSTASAHHHAPSPVVPTASAPMAPTVSAPINQPATVASPELVPVATSGPAV